MAAKQYGLHAVRLLVMIIALCPFVSAQGSGDGLSKYTRGQSAPRQCIKFFKRYLNGVEQNGKCPEGRCECGTQGRVQVAPDQPETPGFGVHSINCSYHPYEQTHFYGDYGHDCACKQVNGFEDGYNQHLDSHLGVYVHDLHKTMKLLGEDKAPYYGMTWTEGQNSYYSVMTVACRGYFIEFLSEKATGFNVSTFHETEEIRFDFANFSRPDREVEYSAVKVSRATTKIDEMIDFYTKTIEGQLTRNVTVDGVDIAWVRLNHAPQMLLQFVNRPAAHSADFTVRDLESYVNGVHDDYVKNTNCGFDQFADHHWGYDMTSRTETLSSVAKKLTAGGYKYRWFQTPSAVQIYAFDPSGWTLQLDWSEGNDVPRKIATYSATCKSDDGCYGQGLCNEDVFTPF